MRLTLRADTADATHALGAAIAPHLEAGDVVSLSGPLGAGKTRLVQGLAAGLGVEGRVTSPTFVLVRRHAGRLPLLHCDAYRLERTGDLVALDDDLLAPDVVTCVEWGDAVASALPTERLDVVLAPLASVGGPSDAAASPRDVTLVGHGPSWVRRWADLADALRRTVAP